jgi:hypothetical protein
MGLSWQWPVNGPWAGPYEEARSRGDAQERRGGLRRRVASTGAY